MGWKDWVYGDLVSAADFQSLVQDQTVQRYADSAARTSALGSAVAEGMVTYLADSNLIESYDGSAWQRQSGGLVPVSPTSVVIATGSGSANAVGQVSFTGATSVSLNGVFTSEFKHYRVVVTTSTISAAYSVNIRLRSSGTDYSGAEYHRMMTTTNSAGATASAAAAGGTFLTLGNASNATNTGAGFFDITDPQTTIRKTVNSIFSGYSGSNPASFYGGAYINSTVAYDGLTYFISSGSITGTIQVFGYND